MTLTVVVFASGKSAATDPMPLSPSIRRKAAFWAAVEFGAHEDRTREAAVLHSLI
jgi:hypothetical protein